MKQPEESNCNLKKNEEAKTRNNDAAENVNSLQQILKGKGRILMDDFSEEEIEYICMKITPKKIRAYFQKYPKEFNKIRSGSRAASFPGTALLQKEDGSLYVQKVENQILYWIPVETGVEGDVDLEVIPVEEGSLKAGDLIVTNAVAFLEDGTAVLSNAAN